ncbi:MAG: HEAT repeat domain-containing protein [Polyangiales bacterium]
MRNRPLQLATIVAALALGTVGCRPKPDDPVGQAGQLADANRRTVAIENIQRIYANALANANGDRTKPEVRAVADAVAEPLTRTFIDNPADSQNNARILEIMKDMRDPRTLPALQAALDYRRGVTESQAIAAADTIKMMEVPAGQRAGVITALMKAFDKTRASQGQEGLIQKGVVEALGSLRDRAAIPHLLRIATSENENQLFLINRLALMQVGEIGDADAVPALVKALFMRSKDLRFGMEDVAMGALVRIGRPSLDPLLATLRGQNAEANAEAARQIQLLSTQNMGQGMTAQGLVGERAAMALGALGFAEALDPLLGVARGTDLGARANAAMALLQLNVNDAQRAQVREAVLAVIAAAPADLQGLQIRAGLMGAATSSFDPGYLPIFLAQARTPDVPTDYPLSAAVDYALLANKTEAAQLTTFVQSQDPASEGGSRELFQRAVQPMVDAANACDMDLACWQGKLGDSDVAVARKAAAMIGRLGAGNAGAITALEGQLNHRAPEVRLTVLYAIDHIATAGAPAAVTKIDELRTREDGQAIWRQVGPEATRIQNRLRSRSGS